jgi:hypothetical protein
MEYLIIILVVALALAPLSHFVPSKRQRAVARMRESAALKGLFVEFRQLPGQSGPDAVRSTRGNEGVIYYGKRLPPARGVSIPRGSWVRLEEDWRSTRGTDTPPESLAGLPVSVLAASVDEGSCGIYWRESGGPEDLAQIIAVIESWAASLRPGQG